MNCYNCGSFVKNGSARMSSKFVGMARYQDITIELSLKNLQGLRISPWNDLVAMAEPKLQLADCDSLELWEVLLVEVTLHHGDI